MKIILLLISVFSIICKVKKVIKKVKTKVRKVEDKFKVSQDPENINILTISYELTYEKEFALKVVLKTIDDLEHDTQFDALLKTVEEGKEYNLKCKNISVSIIEYRKRCKI